MFCLSTELAMDNISGFWNQILCYMPVFLCPIMRILLQARSQLAALTHNNQYLYNLRLSEKWRCFSFFLFALMLRVFCSAELG